MAAACHAQTSTQADTSRPTQRETERDQPRRHALCPSRPGCHNTREPFREEAAGTLGVGTDKRADAELPLDARRAPGQISEQARVTAMDTLGPYGADGARHCSLRRGHVQDDSERGVVKLPGIESERGGIR